MNKEFRDFMKEALPLEKNEYPLSKQKPPKGHIYVLVKCIHCGREEESFEDKYFKKQLLSFPRFHDDNKDLDYYIHTCLRCRSL